LVRKGAKYPDLGTRRERKEEGGGERGRERGGKVISGAEYSSLIKILIERFLLLIEECG
jgi:hypothetical protein